MFDIEKTLGGWYHHPLGSLKVKTRIQTAWISWCWFFNSRATWTSTLCLLHDFTAFCYWPHWLLFRLSLL